MTSTPRTAPPTRAATLGRPRKAALDGAIVDAALAELAARGYSRMSLDAVAARAGVSKPTIYLRHASKEDLATAALARLQAQEPVARTGDPRRDLVALLRGFQTSLLRPNGLSMIGTILAEEDHTPELIARFRRRIVAPRRRMVRAIFHDAKMRGLLRAGADIDAAVNLLIGSFYARYLAGQPFPRDWPRRIVEVVWKGVKKPR